MPERTRADLHPSTAYSSIPGSSPSTIRTRMPGIDPRGSRSSTFDESPSSWIQTECGSSDSRSRPPGWLPSGFVYIRFKIRRASPSWMRGPRNSNSFGRPSPRQGNMRNIPAWHRIAGSDTFPKKAADLGTASGVGHLGPLRKSPLRRPMLEFRVRPNHAIVFLARILQLFDLQSSSPPISICKERVKVTIYNELQAFNWPYPLNLNYQLDTLAPLGYS